MCEVCIVSYVESHIHPIRRNCISGAHARTNTNTLTHVNSSRSAACWAEIAVARTPTPITISMHKSCSQSSRARSQPPVTLSCWITTFTHSLTHCDSRRSADTRGTRKCGVRSKFFAIVRRDKTATVTAEHLLGVQSARRLADRCAQLVFKYTHCTVQRSREQRSLEQRKNGTLTHARTQTNTQLVGCSSGSQADDRRRQRFLAAMRTGRKVESNCAEEMTTTACASSKRTGYVRERERARAHERLRMRNFALAGLVHLRWCGVRQTTLGLRERAWR